MIFRFRGSSPRLATITVAAALLGATAAHAQTTETASQDLRIRAFGMYSHVDTDYAGGVNNGGTFGVDVDFKIPHVRGIKPGVDIREVISSGSIANQRVFSGGPQIVLSGGRYHPYFDFLVGSGTISFPHPTIPGYTHDNSFVYTLGGGIDVTVHGPWAVRADYQRQQWKLQESTPSFYPTQFSIGLRYQVHLRNKYGPE